MLVCIALLLACCQSADTSTLAKSNAVRQPSPGLSAEVIQSFTADNNQFALDLHHQLRQQEGNLVFSPYSLSSALAMTFAGSRAQTEAQMAAAMHFKLPQEELHPAFNQLEQTLISGIGDAGTGQPLIIKVANSIWADQSLPMQDAYLDTIASNYGAGVHLTDFAGAKEQARREINAWVGQQTEKRIKNLITEGALESSTRMVLVNAIYFKGDWQDPFDPADTRIAPFRLLDGGSVDVPMMHSHPSGAGYFAGDGFQAVQLPYVGNTAAMTILVPEEGRIHRIRNSPSLAANSDRS